MLGLVLLRGDEVIALTIEGPPPADALTAKAQNAPVSLAGNHSRGQRLPTQHMWTTIRSAPSVLVDVGVSLLGSCTASDQR